MAAEPVHRGLRREARARARLVEGRQQRLAGEQVGVLAVARDRRELVADLEDALELGALKALERQDVAPEKAPHLDSFRSRVVISVDSGEQHGHALVVARRARRRGAQQPGEAGRAGRVDRDAGRRERERVRVGERRPRRRRAASPPVASISSTTREPVVGLVVEDAVGDAVRLVLPRPHELASGGGRRRRPRCGWPPGARLAQRAGDGLERAPERPGALGLHGVEARRRRDRRRARPPRAAPRRTRSRARRRRPGRRGGRRSCPLAPSAAAIS